MIGGLAERYVSLKAQWLFFLQNPTGCDWIDIFQILGIGLAVTWSARASFFALQTHRFQALLARGGPLADRDKLKLDAALGRIRQGLRELAGKRATATIDQRQPIRLYDHDDELLLCNVGCIRPRVLVSRGVVRLLDDEELAAGLAHELAHVVRRDNLKRAVAEVTCFAAPVLIWWADALRLAVSPGRLFLFDLALGLSVGLALRMLLMPLLVHWQERRCDEWAAAATGDRLAVASALIKMARSRPAMTAVPQPATAFAFHGDPLTRRIRSLTRRRSSRLVLAIDRGLRLPLRLAGLTAVVLGVLAVHRAEATELAPQLEVRSCQSTVVSR